jgi:hypothetical protein
VFAALSPVAILRTSADVYQRITFASCAPDGSRASGRNCGQTGLLACGCQGFSNLQDDALLSRYRFYPTPDRHCELFRNSVGTVANQRLSRSCLDLTALAKTARSLAFAAVHSGSTGCLRISKEREGSSNFDAKPSNTAPGGEERNSDKGTMGVWLTISISAEKNYRSSSSTPRARSNGTPPKGRRGGLKHLKSLDLSREKL